MAENHTSDEEIDLYPEPESSYGKRFPRANQSDVTVASEVLRGIKLRQRKPYGRKNRCPVIINLPKLHRICKRKSCKVASHSIPECNHCKLPPGPKSMIGLTTSRKKTRLKIRIKAENKAICPLRIAELAVPSKRHCIDTWRYKSYLLPETMVDRLKQHVLDQRPVVQISDAVYCFQKRKSRLHKKKPFKDALSHWKKKMEIPLRKQNTRTLCLIFAHKIIQKLLIPMKIEINSDLENLSRVIVSEIVRITKGKKYMTTAYLRKYRSVNADPINKITTWVVGIIEDLAYKQLEEDLRELEEEEGPVLDFLDDLLENVYNICLPVTLEVYIEEESEKSVSSNSLTSKYTDGKLNDTEYFQNEIMKLIDDGQVETIEAISDISNENDLLTEINEILSNILKESVASDDTINDNNDLVTDADYFENEIINIMSIVCKESEDKIENINNDSILTVEDNIKVVQLPIEHNFENDLKEPDDAVADVQSPTKHSSADNLKESIDLDAEIQLPTTHSSADNLKESVDPSAEVELPSTHSSADNLKESVDPSAEFELPSTHSSADNLKESVDPSAELELPSTHSSADNLKESVDPSAEVQLPTTHSSAENVTGFVDTLSEDTDDRSKKVMFSVFDIVNPRDAVSSSELTGIPSSPKESMKFYNSYLKRNMIFAEPNTHLLSKADESWPSLNFSSAVLRPSASVTKSLTSLGKFSEHDEEDFSLSIISSNVDEQENVNTALINNQIKHLVTSPTTPMECANSEERSIKTTTNNDTLISLKDSISLTKSVKRDEELITAEIKTTYNHILHNKEVQVNTNCRDDGSQTDEIKKPHVNLGTSRQLVTSVDPELTADKFDSKNIFNTLKKDTLKTSKNMETVTKDNKLFLVSQLTKSIQNINDCYQLSQYDFHKWCNELDEGFKNLEIWQEWLQNACNQTIDVLKNKNHHTCLRKYMKTWQKLKKDVYSDAVLWTKVNHNTQGRFKCYRKYYIKKEIGHTNSNATCICKIHGKKTT